MLTHVVLFRWNDSVPSGYADVAKTELLKYAATLSGVVSYHCGPNAGVSENGADFGIVAVFESAEDWHRYDTDDEHNRIRREIFAPYVADRSVIQFKTD